MIANPPENTTAAQGHVSIAWPQDLLVDAQGRIAGYVMPHMKGMRPIADFYHPKTRRAECPFFTYRYLAVTAQNLATAIRALHRRDYIMGDVNESNVLVAQTAMVTLVDTDSFQVREPGSGKVHRCIVGTEFFTPREMQGVNFATVDRREEHDLFGLGVLLFQLLMEGSHPFQIRFAGVGEPPELNERIRDGRFPHGTGSAMWQPPPQAPPFEMIDVRLRGLFTRCFVNGHRNPKARPTADEWRMELADAITRLVPCKVNPSHYYWPHANVCPWCERTEKLKGRDPFPDPAQVRPGGRGSHLARPTPEPWKPAGVSGPTSTAHKPGPAVSWWKRLWGTPAAAPAPSLAATQTPAPKPIQVVVPSKQAPAPKPVQMVVISTQTPTPKPVQVAVPTTPIPAPKPVQIVVPAPQTPAPAPKPVQVVGPTTPVPAPKPLQLVVPRYSSLPSGLSRSTRFHQPPKAVDARYEAHLGREYTHQGLASKVELFDCNVWIWMGEIKLIVHESDIRLLGGLKFLESLRGKQITATGILIFHPDRKGLQMLITKRSQINF